MAPRPIPTGLVLALALCVTVQAAPNPATSVQQLNGKTLAPLPAHGETSRANRLLQPDQLTVPEKRARSPGQITSELPSVKSSPPLTGRDRCDPGTGGARQADCANVLETRSAEFARPDPGTLSPEQRLLGAEGHGAGAYDAGQAAEQLARGGPADSLAAQGIAFSQQQAQSRMDAPKADATAQPDSSGLPYPASVILDILTSGSR